MLHGHVNVVLKPGIFYQDNPLFSSLYNVFRPDLNLFEVQSL